MSRDVEVTVAIDVAAQALDRATGDTVTVDAQTLAVLLAAARCSVWDLL